MAEAAASAARAASARFPAARPQVNTRVHTSDAPTGSGGGSATAVTTGVSGGSAAGSGGGGNHHGAAATTTTAAGAAAHPDRAVDADMLSPVAAAEALRRMSSPSHRSAHHVPSTGAMGAQTHATTGGMPVVAGVGSHPSSLPRAVAVTAPPVAGRGFARADAAGAPTATTAHAVWLSPDDDLHSHMPVDGLNHLHELSAASAMATSMHPHDVPIAAAVPAPPPPPPHGATSVARPLRRAGSGPSAGRRARSKRATRDAVLARQRRRKRYTPQQLGVLEDAYSASRRPSNDALVAIAQSICEPVTRVRSCCAACLHGAHGNTHVCVCGCVRVWLCVCVCGCVCLLAGEDLVLQPSRQGQDPHTRAQQPTPGCTGIACTTTCGSSCSSSSWWARPRPSRRHHQPQAQARAPPKTSGACAAGHLSAVPGGHLTPPRPRRRVSHRSSGGRHGEASPGSAGCRVRGGGASPGAVATKPLPP